MGLGDLLGAVEEVFHKWEGTKCRPIGAYTQEPVSLNWILRLWKIVHPPDDCGEGAVTYIAVVSSTPLSLLQSSLPSVPKETMLIGHHPSARSSILVVQLVFL